MNSFNNHTFEDFFNLACGKEIGYGHSRKVFDCNLNPDWVVKVEIEEFHRSFGNVIECSYWDNNKYSDKIAKWLAPCHFLSPDGKILIQSKTQPVRDCELPEKLPSFLTDIKKSNFGLLNGNLVCHDYAITIISSNTKLKNVEWF